MQAELHPPVRGAFDAKKANQNGAKVGRHQPVQCPAGCLCMVQQGGASGRSVEAA
jgi:hypothetical protein